MPQIIVTVPDSALVDQSPDEDTYYFTAMNYLEHVANQLMLGNIEGHEDANTHWRIEWTPDAGTPAYDTESPASRQHFIDTGRYLKVGEAL